MRRLLLVSLALFFLAPALAAPDDTPKAAETRKKLEKKITVEYKEQRLKDVLDDLKEQADLHFKEDTKGGVNLNAPVTYKAKDKTVAQVLSDISTKIGDGFYVRSGKNDAYDGLIQITRGKERGYKAGEEPKGAAKTSEKPTKTVKEKPEKPKAEAPKEKPRVEPKPEKATPAEDDADELERKAARSLKVAKEVKEDGDTARCRDLLKDLIKRYPKTKAAEEAKKLLKDEDK